jgi:hypothetical protein
VEGRDGLFASECDAAEAFDPVEEPFHEVAFLVERPVDQFGPAARRVLLDLRHRSEFVGDEIAQVIRIIARIRDDMSDPLQPFEQALRLRAVASVSEGDENPDRQRHLHPRRRRLQPDPHSQTAGQTYHLSRNPDDTTNHTQANAPGSTDANRPNHPPKPKS